jgi:hypothetical protein
MGCVGVARQAWRVSRGMYGRRIVGQARRGLMRQSRQREVERGPDGLGEAVEARPGLAGSGMFGCRMFWQGRRGKARSVCVGFVLARRGSRGPERTVLARSGAVRSGNAVMAGEARTGRARTSRARQRSLGCASRGAAWRSMSKQSRRGVGEAWKLERVVERRGEAVTERFGPSRHG